MALPLVFQSEVARAKPEDVVSPSKTCPFCSLNELQLILKQEQNRIWLVNKYRTLAHTYQTVIIESANHQGEISNYSKEENQAVFEFAIKCWQELIASRKYQSVLMYKNFGPLAGGSLRHPHMQIVGLENQDGMAALVAENFNGITVLKQPNLEINLSEQPIMGFVEVNIIVDEFTQIAMLAASVQETVKYVLNQYFGGKCNSYNLFFYQFQGKIVCKVIPRFIVSPYFVGYRLTQVNTGIRMKEIRDELREKFL